MQKALVVLSGGQDSTICLFWAVARFQTVEAITFDYGQRHRIELESAKKVAALAGVPQVILPIDTFEALGGNALTSLQEDVATDVSPNALPNTFVAGRNLIFLTFAAAYAYPRNIQHLVTGVCETDYSGYPDCRNNTIQALQVAINLGMEARLNIHTPLMWLTKAESVTLAQEVGAMEALAWTHTCYKGQYPPCGTCAACKIRQQGFETAQIPDPLVARAFQDTP